MGENISLESRLARLEAKVNALVQRIERDPSKADWVEKIVGTFENEPDFAEVLRRGREYRQTFDDPNQE